MGTTWRSPTPAFLTFAGSVGKLNPEANSEIAAVLTSLIAKHFSVPTTNIYIEFVDPAPAFFAVNGKTLAPQ